MTAAIEAHQLTRRFGKLVAVDHVDLQVEDGELFGLLGPNGAGKTTLIRMLTGLQSITEGTARVAGVDVRKDATALRRAISVVPQALTSDLDLTGYENLDIYARFFSVPRAQRRARIEQLLKSVELWDRRDDLVSTYSGGMRRRLEIARGLIHRPRVLFLDEPTIGLDPQSRHVIWDLLRELRKGGGLTISLTTHYLDEAQVLCDRVAIVDRGRIVALGTPTELKASVPGSDTIELTLDAPVDDTVAGAVGALHGVRKLDRLDGVEGAPPRLLVHADGGPGLLPRVIELLTAARVKVLAASVSQISLEDVFIHVTGRSLRDTAANSNDARRAGLPRRFS
ncbi:MAG: ATP-binding cassette domain-containing protein [Polyangiales bacterium]